MAKKRDFVIGSVIVYCVLITLFICLKDKEPSLFDCGSQNCIRFCCFDNNTCNDNFIQKNFYPASPDQSFKIITGSPKCSMKVLEFEKDLTFDRVRLELTLIIFVFNQFVFVRMVKSI